MVHLHDLGGLWRRTLIAWPDGRTDTTTEVLWLQGPSLFADLRIPGGRPAGPWIACLRDLDRIMLQFMARQEGFFGELAVNGSVGTWRRVFDYQPDSGVADRGALAFDGDILVERGIERPYAELWSRSSADVGATALLLEVEGVPGCVVIAGDLFMYARGRATPLPRGIAFSQLVEDAPSLDAAQDLFDCEISFGRHHGSNWRIERSSHCFREGKTFSSMWDGDAGSLVIDDVAPNGKPMKRAWRVKAHEGVVPFHRFEAVGASQPSQQTQ